MGWFRTLADAVVGRKSCVAQRSLMAGMEDSKAVVVAVRIVTNCNELALVSARLDHEDLFETGAPLGGTNKRQSFS